MPMKLRKPKKMLTTKEVAKLRGILKGKPSPLKGLLRERKRDRYV